MPAPSADWNAPAWQGAETLRVTHFPWEDSGHRPDVQARALYDRDALYIHFRVEDQYVRAVAKKFQDSVCVDSCVGVFRISSTQFGRLLQLRGQLWRHNASSPLSIRH